MLKKYSIPFLLCIIVLVFSEYYFLQEVTSRQRVPVLALTITGVGVSIFLFSLLYKKLGKANR